MDGPEVQRLRGGADQSDDEEGPDADLTLGILAKHQRRKEDGTTRKRKKKGALDRLEERERSRSSMESDQDSRKKKKRKLKEIVSARKESSSEEEGQIVEEKEDAGGNGSLDLDLNIEETTGEKRTAHKVTLGGPSLEAPDSSPPRDAAQDSLVSGDMLTMQNLRGRRYWDPPEENEQRCFNCGETGHKAWTCPAPKKERPCFVCGKFGHIGSKCPTGKLCFVCGKGGHEARDCPKKGMRRGAGWASGEGQEGDVCYKCGWEGHSRAECWRDYDEADLALIRCYICGKHGHLSCVEVTENGPSEVTCYQCGQAGHTGDGCARSRGGFERDDGGITCYRCGEKGHIAKGCSKQDNYFRNRRPAFYEREVYSRFDEDRYDPDQEYQDYDNYLDEPEYDYVRNSRSKDADGNEDGLWLGTNSHRSSRREDSRYQAGVSKGSNRYGNRRYSEGYGYESRRSESSRYEEGYHGYNEEPRRSKSTGRQRWNEEPQEEPRWRKGSKQRSGDSSHEPHHRRSKAWR